MTVISTRAAALRLGVSDRRVRSLIARGDLNATRAGRAYLVDEQSLARLEGNRGSGRSLSPRMSWVALLTDLGTSNVGELVASAGLSRSERARLRSLGGRPVQDWSWLVRRRAVTQRYSVRDAYFGRLLSDERLARSGVSALEEFSVGLSPRGGTGEGYVDQRDLAGFESDYLLRADLAGGLIIHAVDARLLLGRFGLAPTMTAATVGVDLAESDDPRTRRAGYELLRTLADG
jgi:excisionase family DNA binding protein